jgi:antitoxin VapB
MSELELKLDRIRRLLRERGLGGLLLARVSSFAWATCGAASYVNTATTFGEATLLITHEARYILTNNIEAERLEHEEQLPANGWEIRASPWHASLPPGEDPAQGLRLGADFPRAGALDLSSEVARLRAELTPEEDERFRRLGRSAADAMGAAIRRVRPGQSEFEIAAALSQECESRGVQAVVNLVASDERILRFRHPLPTGKKLDRTAMLVLCGRSQGLVCSVTRLICFGRLEDELRRKHDAVVQVDAAMIGATRPGAALREVLRAAVSSYAGAGWPDEWRHHHQGGPAAYEPREWVVTPESSEVVREGQVFAWNPSIRGTKSEDTILVGPLANDVLTAIPDWPTISVPLGGGRIERPAILEIR